MPGNKVVRYKRRPRAVAFIFALVLIYIICFFVLYTTKAKVQTYEVNVGSLTNNAVFTALAVREESVYNSPYSGNVNYYQREGTRVKKGDTIYTVDETGRVSEILSSYNKLGENSLSEKNLSDIKTTLNNYKTDYDGSDFTYVYDLKSDLNVTVLQSINENVVANLDSIVENTGSQNLFQTVTAESNGIVVYAVDGYEQINDNNVTTNDFNKDNYNKNNLKGESLIVSGNPAYKIVTSEDWYMLIRLSKDDIDEYGLASKKSLNIKIKKDNMTVVLITHYLEEMAACDVLNVLIEGNLYYSGDIANFIKQHSTTNLNLTLKPGKPVNSLSVSKFANKCQILSEAEVVCKDVSVEEMMEIIAENQGKSIIETFNVEYSNLEAAYLNLLKSKGGEGNA